MKWLLKPLLVSLYVSLMVLYRNDDQTEMVWLFKLLSLIRFVRHKIIFIYHSFPYSFYDLLMFVFYLIVFKDFYIKFFFFESSFFLPPSWWGFFFPLPLFHSFSFLPFILHITSSFFLYIYNSSFLSFLSFKFLFSLSSFFSFYQFHFVCFFFIFLSCCILDLYFIVL